MQAACKVEQLNTEYFLKVILEMHLQVFAIAIALTQRWILLSEYSLGAPCFFYVPKPNGGLQIYIDYCRLNEITKKNAYPLPLISDLIDHISEACIHSCLDFPDVSLGVCM
jgi:hypothetical protein